MDYRGEEKPSWVASKRKLSWITRKGKPEEEPIRPRAGKYRVRGNKTVD